MLSILLEVLSQLQGMWRFRWQALTLVWSLCVLGWTYTLAVPNQYQATARVFVDPQSALESLLRGLAVSTDMGTQVDLITRTLFNRKNLEKVARRTDLQFSVDNPQELDEIIGRLRSNVQMRAGQEKNLYTISYRDSDRERAKIVVSALMDSFVEDTRGANLQGSATAQHFLDQQIAEYEQRLAVAERNVADFKKENVGLMPGTNANYYSRLQAALTEMRAVETEIDVLEKKEAELEKQLAGELPSFGLMQPQSQSAAVPEDPAIASFRERLNELLLQYTDAHPDVLALRATIEQLERRREAETPPGILQVPVDAGVDLNPLYQNLKLAASDVKVQLVEARARRAQMRAQVAELRSLVDAVPEVEAQMTRLNRDYQITKQRYEALLERREIARLSEDAEVTRDDVRFQIVDPPSVGLEPVFPKRSLFFTVALVVALGGGLGTAFFLNQLKPVFNNRKLLEEACGFPVIGAVERVWTASEHRRLKAKTATFFAALSLVPLAYGLILAFQGPTAEMVQALIERI